MEQRRRAPRKPPPRRRPVQRKPAQDPARARLIGGAAVGALLVVLLVVVVLITGGGGDDGDATAGTGREAATPTATATATPTPRPDPTPRPLTAAQRSTRDMAADLVDEKGFEVTRVRDFDPRKTLQVLIGRSASGNELAFFFVDGEYIGNDSTESSQSITVRRGGDDTSAILRYAVASGDPVDVTFRWDGTRLQPSPAIPSSADRA